MTKMDYYPTILEMCGLPLLPDQHVDGKSFVDALEGREEKNNRELFWHQDKSRPESTGDHNSTVVRKGRFKLHYFLDDGRIELYNLNSDPYEEKNIAENKPELVEELLGRMEPQRPKRSQCHIGSFRQCR